MNKKTGRREASVRDSPTDIKKRKRRDGRVTRGMEGGSEGREHRARKIGYKEVMSVQKSVSI